MRTLLLRFLARRIIRGIRWARGGGIRRLGTTVRRAWQEGMGLPGEMISTLRRSGRGPLYICSLAAYLFAVWVGGLTASLVLLVLLAAVFDLWKRRIYNYLTLPALVVGLGCRLATGGMDGLLAGLGGCAVGFGVMLVLFLLGGMGGGDVKLMSAVGVYLGWELSLRALVFAMVIGAACALVMIVVRGRVRQTFKNICLMLVSLVVPGMRPAPPPKEGALYLPFGLAIALATLFVLWELFRPLMAASSFVLAAN